MAFTLHRHTAPQDFLARASSMLLRHEVENNLLFGIVGVLRDHPDYYEEPPYLASVEREGAPVACAARTPPFGLILTRMPEEALVLVADDVEAAYGAIPGVVGPAPTAEAFATVWCRRTGADARVKMRQRIYRLDRVHPPEHAPPGRMRQATEGDADLLAAWIDAFNREAGGAAHRDAGKVARHHLDAGAAFLWDDGRPVSMAVWAGPTPNGIRIGGVYTPPDLRRRGYASALVAELSQRMLNQGRAFCSLYTDLSNPTSNRIYQTIGYEPVCDSTMYEFETSEE